MQSQIETLANGLQTLFINGKGTTCATAQIWFRAGSALEDKANQGIAHFLEHMFFKGTKKRPGVAIARQVEEVGGEMNAFTSFDYTCYYINIPNQHLPRAVDILLDMVTNPMFKNGDIKIEREVVLEEYLRSIDEPGQYRFKKIQEASFSKGYGHSILGTTNTIKKFTLNQLQTFRKRNYGLANAMLVVGGDLDKQKGKLISIAAKYKMPDGIKTTFSPFNLRHPVKVQVHEKEVKTSSVTITIEAPTITEKMAAREDMAISCLGHGESSPLYQTLVVEKNVAIGTSASSMFFNHGGVHFIKISFAPENMSKALTGFAACLQDTITKGFSLADIEKIRNQYVAGKTFERETMESFAFSLGHSFAQMGNIHAEEQFLQTIRNLKPQEINLSLADLFLKNMHIEMQLPKGSDTKAAEKQLKQFASDIRSFEQKLKKQMPKSKPSKNDPQCSLIEIKPGIKLLHRHNTIAGTFLCQTFLNSGLSDETLGNLGDHNMVSALIPMANKNKERFALSTFFEERSANFSGFSGKNAYGTSLHGLSQHFEELSEEFMECFNAPKFKESDLITEKELVIQTLLNKSQDPARLCFSKVNEIMFPNHSYGLDSLGTEDTIEKMTVQSLMSLHEKNIKEKEMLICVFGDIGLDLAADFVVKHTNHLSARNAPTPFRTKGKYNSEICHINLDREQNHVYIGVPTKGIFEHDTLVSKMLTSFLSGQSSKLFYEMRDVYGLCYAIRAFQFAALEHGHWGIYFASAPGKTQKAIDIVNQAISTLVRQMNKAQFEKLKLMIDGQNKLAMQTNEDFASAYSLPLLHGKGIEYHHTECEKVAKMKYQDFIKGMNSLLSNHASMVMCGPGIV